MRWVMPVEDILSLISNDAVSFDKDRYDLPGFTVGDELEVKEIDDEYHLRVMKVMAREHVNLVPILVINDVLYNGHRRVKIARELGLEEMLVTDDWHDSGWHDEYTVIGEEE